MVNHHKSTMKSISKLITQSSQHFFSSFLEDTPAKDKKRKERNNILKKLQLAAAQKSLVVLQIQETSAAKKFETVSGWVISKKVTDTIMLRSPDDQQQILMVHVAQIKKISLLSRTDKRQIK